MKNLIAFVLFLVVACAPRTGPAGLNGLNGSNGRDGINGVDGVPSTTDMVYICHKYKKNGNHYAEMYAPETELQMHFDHGDFLGECEQ